MIRNLLFILTWIFSTSLYANSQRSSRVISGLVTSSEDAIPLPGVTVLVKGTKNISGSQQDGMYYIEVSDRDSVLVFRLDEFKSCEIKLTAADNYNIALDKGADQTPKPPFSAIGTWRAVFQLKPGVEVPFNFEIRSTKRGGLRAFFRNGDERFDGGRVTTTADSLFIFLDQFDNELAFQIGDQGLTGGLRKQDRSGSCLPVKAEAGVNYRFPDNGAAPAGNLSGNLVPELRG